MKFRLRRSGVMPLLTLYAIMAHRGTLQANKFFPRQLILFETSGLCFQCTGIAVCLLTHKSSLFQRAERFRRWLIYCINYRGMFYCARYEVLIVDY
jgi:hypothetical protein